MAIASIACEWFFTAPLEDIAVRRGDPLGMRAIAENPDTHSTSYQRSKLDLIEPTTMMSRTAVGTKCLKMRCRSYQGGNGEKRNSLGADCEEVQPNKRANRQCITDSTSLNQDAVEKRAASPFK